MLSAPPARRRPDPTLTLINVVFLMLVFFLVGGQLAPPQTEGLTLVRTQDLDPTAPPDALVLMADGSLMYRGTATDPAAHVAALSAEERGRVRIVADRAAPALRLVAVSNALRAAGATEVVLVTEQGLE